MSCFYLAKSRCKTCVNNDAKLAERLGLTSQGALTQRKQLPQLEETLQSQFVHKAPSARNGGGPRKNLA